MVRRENGNDAAREGDGVSAVNASEGDPWVAKLKVSWDGDQCLGLRCAVEIRQPEFRFLKGAHGKQRNHYHLHHRDETTAGTEYNVRVRATRTHADNGEWSDEKTGTTNPGPPRQVPCNPDPTGQVPCKDLLVVRLG